MNRKIRTVNASEADETLVNFNKNRINVKINNTKISDANINNSQYYDDESPRDLPLTIDNFFATAAKPLTCISQSSVYFEGDAAQSVYLIESGLVKLLTHLPNGRARIVRILGKGSIFGLEGLLRESAYKHSAMAVGNVVTYRIAVGRLRGFMQNSAELTGKIIEHWHNHLFCADTWITQFSAGAIKSRVARLVNFLGLLEYGQDSLCVRLLTCEEMAEVLGVTPESVSRVLAQFKRDHILSQIQDRPFEVFTRDKSRLQAVAGF